MKSVTAAICDGRMFRVGDRVIPMKPKHCDEWPHWLECMDKFSGKVGEITFIHIHTEKNVAGTAAILRIQIGDKTEEWCFRLDWLQKV